MIKETKTINNSQKGCLILLLSVVNLSLLLSIPQYCESKEINLAGNNEKLVFKTAIFLQNQSEYYNRAIENANKGNFKEAENNFEDILKTDKFNYLAKDLLTLLKRFDTGKVKKEYVKRFFRGLIYLNDNNDKFAIEEFKKIIEDNPNYAIAYVMLGVSYAQSNQIQQAIAYCKKAANIEPEYAYPYIVLASLYRSLHNFKEARVVLYKARLASRLQGDNYAVANIDFLLYMLQRDEHHFHYATGTIAASHGKFKRARDEFEKALFIDPTDYESLNSLNNIKDLNAGKIKFRYAVQLFIGLNYLRNGKQEEAIRELKKAIEIDPKYARAYSSIGSAFFISRWPQEAIAYYNKAIEVNPKYFMPYYNLGVVYQSLGQLMKAIPSYKKAIKLYPAYSPSYSNLGIIYRKLGDSQKALTYYLKAIENNTLFYDDPYINLGSVYFDTGKLQEAMACYQKATQIDPFDAQSYCGLGEVYLKMNKFEEALSYFERAIMLNSSDPDFYAGVADAYVGLKQLRQAIPFYKKAIDLDPMFAPFYNNLANTQFILGQYQETKKNLEKALNLYKSQGNLQWASIVEANLKNYPWLPTQEKNISMSNQKPSSQNRKAVNFGK